MIAIYTLASDHAVSTAFHGNCNLRERAVKGNDALRISHLYAMMHSEIATCMPTIMLYQTRQCNSGNGMTILATHLPASQNKKQRQEAQSEDKTSHN